MPQLSDRDAPPPASELLRSYRTQDKPHSCSWAYASPKIPLWEGGVSKHNAGRAPDPPRVALHPSPLVKAFPFPFFLKGNPGPEIQQDTGDKKNGKQRKEAIPPAFPVHCRQRGHTVKAEVKQRGQQNRQAENTEAKAYGAGHQPTNLRIKETEKEKQDDGGANDKGQQRQREARPLRPVQFLKQTHPDQRGRIGAAPRDQRKNDERDNVEKLVHIPSGRAALCRRRALHLFQR
ncbi:hypothetical protein [uncultured Desulfovibrio sp.]|uniref:hypothetical protein n=1 Tax=uncultured Desulfovibrio sp. TaxID=167968 RepID=UPI00262B7627|nr:hypothetical protein [uncultured Desulfovibrio sp.]